MFRSATAPGFSMPGPGASRGTANDIGGIALHNTKLFYISAGDTT